MATYTRTYIYTGQNGWDVGRRSVALSKFKISGDTRHEIGEILSICYSHYHSSTSSRNYALCGRLVFSDGTKIDSTADLRRISANTPVKFTNAWQELPTAAQFARLESIQTIIEGGDASTDGHLTWNASSKYKMVLTITFSDVPPTNYKPEIETLQVRRVDANGAESDDGAYIAADIKLKIGDGAPLEQAKLTLYTGKTEEITDETLAVDLSSRIPALLLGVEYDTTIITGEFTAGANWFFTLAFEIGSESARKTAAVYRAFVPMTTSAYGAGFGGISTATEDDPKTEFFTPAVFEDDVRMYGGLANIQAGAIEALGNTAGGSTQDGEVVFAKPFAEGTTPVVIIGFQSSSAAGSFGRCSVSVISASNTGFDFRFFNGDDSNRNPGYAYIAFGVPAKPTT